MPIHDWMHVDPEDFHHFHVLWIGDLARLLNQGLLPDGHYALAEPLLAADETEAVPLHKPGSTIVIRHRSGHRVVAMIEIISPGNKSSRHALQTIVRKAVEVIRAGIHLLVVDLFPPGPRDPQGLHKAIWDEFIDTDFALPQDKRLTLAAYCSETYPEAFVQPTAVGLSLPDMPLFLSPDVYIDVPLDATYQSAWEAVPSFWRAALLTPPGGA